MKATGEVMVIDRTFEAAIQKAARSLEIGGRTLLWEDPSWSGYTPDSLDKLPLDPNDTRLWAIVAALRREMPLEDLVSRTFIEPWFIHAFQRIVDMERRLLAET